MLTLKRTLLCQMLLLGAFLMVPFPADAGTISVSPAGGSSFTLQADGFVGPAGFQLMVSYDSTSLTNPRVVQGSLTSGGLFVTNTNVAGQVQLAVVSQAAWKGSGPIATITFDAIGAAAGTINVSGKVINASGQSLPATFSGWAASTDAAVADTGSSTATSSVGTGGYGSSSTTAGTGGSTAAPAVLGGTLVLPSGDAPSPERRETTVAPQQAPAPAPQVAQESEEPLVSATASAEVPVTEPQPAKKKELSAPLQSVLEKFRLFSGEKSPKNLIALFDVGQGASYRQTPAICIADGKRSVKVIITKVPGDKAPNFSVTGAHSLSLRPIGDGAWQVEAIPDQGASRASISMLADGGQLEIPLTVAPPARVDLTRSGTVTMADFLLFLTTRGTDAAPAFDLNGDGKRDYQDDYIFTANYLARGGGK